jgi:Winged helix DNA-binding domain
VRLLPVQDPYLQQRDRATVIPDAAWRKKLWRPVQGPGGVLVDGEIVGTWRSRIKGLRLSVTVEGFSGLTPPTREAIADEAERVAPFRGCETVEVSFAD